MASINRRDLIATGLLGVGFGAAFPSRSFAQAAKFRFAMPTTPANYLLPYFSALDQGWLLKGGIDVEGLVVIGDVNAFRALVSGSADATVPAISPVLAGVAEGAKVKVVSSWQPVVDYFIVARKGLSTKPADLGTMTWGTAGPGGVTSAVSTLYMKKHGLDPAKAKTLSVGDQSSRLQALVGGKVDVTILDSYVTTRAERAGQLTPVTSVVEEFPGMGNVFLVVDQKSLGDAAKRKAILAMVKGGIEGARFVMKEPAKAAELMEKHLTNADVGLLTETLVRVNKLGIWGVDGGLDRKIIDYTAGVYFDEGIVSRKVTFEELVDTSLVEEAIRDLGRFQ